MVGYALQLPQAVQQARHRLGGDIGERRGGATTLKWGKYTQEGEAGQTGRTADRLKARIKWEAVHTVTVHSSCLLPKGTGMTSEQLRSAFMNAAG